MSLREAWESEARNWIAWARAPRHDSYWRFHRDRFLPLLPAPAGPALDVGCGEGRLTRDLRDRGYDVTGIDASPTLLAAARDADPDGRYVEADAARLPVPDEAAALVVAFMSFQDVDDLDGALSEAARVLAPGGHLCMAIVHPMNSAGTFIEHTPDAPFVIRESYFERRRTRDTFERDGLRMTFTSEHRPLQVYADGLAAAGFAIERLVEVADSSAPPGDRWQRLPMFLHLRAVRPAGGVHPGASG